MPNLCLVSCNRLVTLIQCHEKYKCIFILVQHAISKSANLIQAAGGFRYNSST